MDKKTKQSLFLITFGVVLFALLMNIKGIFGFMGTVWKIIFPVALGFVIAFILNVPMNAFEKLILKLTSRCRKKPKQGLVCGISLALTVISLLFVVFLIVNLLVPELVSSITSLYNTVMEKLPSWMETLASYGINIDKAAHWLENADIEKLMQTLTSGAGTVISSTASILISTLSGAWSFLVSVIIAIYALLSKDELVRHGKVLINSYVKSPINEYIFKITSMINDTFTKFLSGQCVEALILGTLIFIAFKIFNVPYAGLVAVLTTVFAFIPYIGAFLSCGIGAVLLLLTAPDKIIAAILIYLVIQFVETQFIYPHVVGNSVGLSPLWTLVAVLVGGNVLGVFGMIFFIPLVAVFFELIKGYTRHRERRKKAEKVQ